MGRNKESEPNLIVSSTLTITIYSTGCLLFTSSVYGRNDIIRTKGKKFCGACIFGQ